jgi:penicillin amidase
MAWILNFNWKADLLYWYLSQTLPQEKFQDIWPEWADYPAIIASEDTEDMIQRLNAIQDIIDQITGMKEIHSGSNSWVISPQRSANGSALLANDPHLRIQFPSIWIELNLKSPELNVAGFSLPGTPGIVIGRNENISWGLTNGMVDDCDFFIEKIDTIAGIYYRENEKRLLSVYKRSVKIKDLPDYHFKVYHTDNGPIFNPSFAGMESTRVVSLKWVGFQNSDELSTFIGFAKARTWADFENSLKSYGVPAQNFVFTDRSGTIGYRLGGLIPLRSYETGLLPQEIGSSQSSWKGWVPFSRMPAKKNPNAGFIVTANNKMMKNFQYYISELWEPPFRAIRINEQIVESGKLNRVDIQRIQTDNTNLMAQEILPLLLAEIPAGNDQPKFIEKIQILLENWDYRMDENSVGAAVFEVWVHCLIENIFIDEMGQPAFELFTDLPNFYLRIFYQTVMNKNSSWFDDVRSTAIENRSDVIYKSFNDALKLLTERRGEHLEDWSWGEIHQLKLMHVLGRVALTNSLLNRGPFPASGNGVTVNAATHAFDSPFAMISGPSCRFIVDWSEPDIYYSIIPGGNSGNFLSQFYDNQINSWLTGGVKRVNLHSNQYAFGIKLIPETK